MALCGDGAHTRAARAFARPGQAHARLALRIGDEVTDLSHSTVTARAAAAKRNAVRQAERRLVVYLDEAQRRWLRSVEADALRDDVRLSASAIIRLAIDELRDHSVGWQDLAGRPPETDDPATQG